MPVGAKIAIDTSGLANVASEAKRRNITLKGVRAGAKVLLPPAKAGAPRRVGSGALKQSQGVKAAKGRKGKTLAYAVQGAKTKTQKTIKVGGKDKVVKPSLYDHLVQGGTRPHQAGNRKHAGARANPYRKRAYDANKAAVGRATADAMAAETVKVIEREAARLLARGK